MNRKAKTIDLTGNKYGKLCVTGLAYIESKQRKAYWKCVCECGTELIVLGIRLRKGETKSCGCITRTLKGLSVTGAYRSYQAMLTRCYVSSSNHYKNYGGRGITVCDRWKSSFMNFLQDMGERPKGKTLDRINNKGNYEPANCKWSTKKEQGNNRRTNRLLTAFGKTLTIAQWVNLLNITDSKLRKRLNRNWTAEEALNEYINLSLGQ